MVLASKKYELFWKKHSENKSEGDSYYSPEFKDLFEKMTILDPEQRIAMDEIKEHPWLTKQCNLSQKDIKDIFN